MEIFSGILAGGSGVRFGNAERPKQFLTLGTKPILIHVLEKFLLQSDIEHHFIGVPKAWLSYTEETIHKNMSEESINALTLVEGGSSRNETILNIINTIEVKQGKEESILITHDAVRPFITGKILRDNIELGKKETAVDTVMEAVDTIIQSEDKDYISHIPIRSEMYQGQTPQTFNMMRFKALYNALNEEEKESLSDAVKVFTMAGIPVKIAPGDERNIKITTPNDLQLANFLLTKHD